MVWNGFTRNKLFINFSVIPSPRFVNALYPHYLNNLLPCQVENLSLRTLGVLSNVRAESVTSFNWYTSSPTLYRSIAFLLHTQMSALLKDLLSLHPNIGAVVSVLSQQRLGISTFSSAHWRQRPHKGTRAPVPSHKRIRTRVLPSAPPTTLPPPPPPPSDIP